MIRRWRSLWTPESVERMRVPTAGEAAGGWFLGTAWVFHALWLAWHGRAAWVPMLLVSGLLALWGWKRRGSVFWFPVAGLFATLVDLSWPASGIGGRRGTCLDLVMTGMALVTVARAIARGWPIGRRPFGEQVMVVALLLGAGLAVLDPRFPTPPALRLALAGVATLAATTAAVRRPRAMGRPWLAFPLAAATLGMIALIASGRGLPGLGVGAPAIGPFLTLACALPLAWAMALKHGSSRPFHFVAAGLGSAGLAVEFTHFAAGLEAAGLSPADPALLFSLGAAMLTGSHPRGVPGLGVGLPGRMWIALSSGIGVLAVAQGDAVTAPVALVLTAIATGLVLGRPEPRRSHRMPVARVRLEHPLRKAA